MNASRKSADGVRHAFRYVGTLVGCIALAMGVTSVPASAATTWYQCYIDHQYYDYSYWSWCYDDPYYWGVVRDQHGNVYRPAPRYAADLYMYNGRDGWEPMHRDLV